MMHVKTGTDRKGRFAIRYEGHRRIRWIREPECNEYFDRLKQAPPSPPSSTGDVASAMNDAASLLYAGSSALGSVAHVAQAVGSLLQWWELRQERLNREIQQTADTRLQLVTNLLDRWVLEHSACEHVDLDLSHYLAREALGLLRLAGESEKVIVPQSLLYEFERVREVVGGVRAMVVRQFASLEASGLIEIASPVEDAKPLRINYASLAKFYGPPEEEWDRAVAQKSASTFEEDLAKLARSPADAMKQVFVIEQEGDVPLLSAAFSDTARVVAASVGGVAAASALRFAVGSVVPVAGVALMIPLAVSLIENYRESKRQENKDAVRELVLFASEVERARFLLRCWEFVQRLTETTRGSRMVSLEDGRNSVLAALGNDGSFTPVGAGTLSTRLLPPTVRRDMQIARLPAKGSK